MGIPSWMGKSSVSLFLKLPDMLRVDQQLVWPLSCPRKPSSKHGFWTFIGLERCLSHQQQLVYWMLLQEQHSICVSRQPFWVGTHVKQITTIWMGLPRRQLALSSWILFDSQSSDQRLDWSTRHCTHPPGSAARHCAPPFLQCPAHHPPEKSKYSRFGRISNFLFSHEYIENARSNDVAMIQFPSAQKWVSVDQLSAQLHHNDSETALCSQHSWQWPAAIVFNKEQPILSCRWTMDIMHGLLNTIWT